MPSILAYPSRLRAFIVFISFIFASAALADRPFISELVAVGNTLLTDEDGEAPDWLEIHNPTDGTLELDGYHLTDNPDNLTKWTFPAVSLAPGAYLIVHASGKDRTTVGSPLHTNFVTIQVV